MKENGDLTKDPVLGQTLDRASLYNNDYISRRSGKDSPSFHACQYPPYVVGIFIVVGIKFKGYNFCGEIIANFPKSSNISPCNKHPYSTITNEGLHIEVEWYTATYITEAKPSDISVINTEGIQ